jgi:hypothetical protein
MPFAVIGSDGLRLVYWGLGASPDAAYLDARDQDGYARTPHDRCVEVSIDIANRIELGDIAVRAGDVP